MTDNLTLAIDIGGSFTKYALVSDSAEIIQKFRIKTNDFISFDLLLGEIKKSIESSVSKVKKIGIGAPNVCPDKSKIINAKNLGWDRVEVVELVNKHFDLPCVLENDANTAAIGEKKLGVAKPFKNFLVITIGTGIGSGLYMNNTLLQGGSGQGSELGHMDLGFGDRVCSCGLKGHVEAYLSCPGMVATHKESYNFSGGFTDLSQRFFESDSDVIRTLKTVAKDFAKVCASINALLSPEAIIFSGGGSILGNEFLSYIQDEYRKIEYPNHRGSTKLMLSKFNPEFGAILGAYSLVSG